MRKIILGTLSALLLILGAFTTGASAAKDDNNGKAGPNGNNDRGLCTAYFNGQKNGHGDGEDGDRPAPFEALEAAGYEYTNSDDEDNDRDGDVDEGDEGENLTEAENVFNFCNDTSIIGGNPEHGRFTCSDEGGTSLGDDTSTDPECNENEGPGNS